MMQQAPDEGLVYVYPRHLEYPDHIRRGLVVYMRQAIYDPTIQWRIAVEPDSKGGRDKVVGLSGWRRKEAVEGEEKTKAKVFRKMSWMDCKCQSCLLFSDPMCLSLSYVLYP